MSSMNAGKRSASGDVMNIGFAKLHGRDFEYYIQFYEIILGRNTKKEKVDLDLSAVGGAKDISRRHARIYYDFEHHTFALEVLGKSGCYVQRVFYLPGDDPVKLDSQDHIQIGGIEFYFLHANRSIKERIAAQGTPQSFTFRGIDYHADPATGSVEHTPIADIMRKYKIPTPIPSQPMSATASAHQPTSIPSQPVSSTASTQHNHIGSQPMSATASTQHNHIPSQPMSATASAQHNHIPSQPMSSSSMCPVHPHISTLHDYNYGSSHGCANGDSGTVISTGTQKTFMKQNNRSLVGLDLNLVPIIEILDDEEEVENSHGCANGDNGIIVGTATQGTNMEQNNRSFGELDLNVEPIGTLDEHVTNSHGCANGNNGIIVGTGTQETNMKQNNRSFGELDLNVHPIETLDEHVENGHGLANGDSGIVVSTGTQGKFMEQINMSFGEINLNVEPTGTLDEHVNEVEITTEEDTDNPQLRQIEENDLMSFVAILVSNHPSTTGWVPAADLHAELITHFSKIWPHSRVQKYLVSEAGSSTGAVEKPWHKLLELLRKCPDKFVTCSLSRGTETSDFVGFLHPSVLF